MALYRTISLGFWTDTKVVDEFTPEDRYFYLYLLTNPHTNLCGCYEISLKQIAYEMGYSTDTIAQLVYRFDNHYGLLKYDAITRELLIFNWSKYNWTSSEKFRKPLLAEIESIKSQSFKEYLTRKANGEKTEYGIDTNCIDTSVTVTVTDSDTVTDKKKEPKKKYGEYQNVKLTDREYEKLIAEYGEEAEEAITYLDEYIQDKHKKYNSHYLTIRRWVINAVREKRGKERKSYSELSADMVWT